jgi:hypothetical protein
LLLRHKPAALVGSHPAVAVVAVAAVAASDLAAVAG